MRTTLWLACACVLLLTIPAAAADSRSEPLAKELATLLQQQKLDVIAAADPADDKRFVAALFFPGQLLVVAGHYAAPSLLAQEVSQKQYREVYTALQGAADAESKVFIQDMGADGLQADAAASVDVMYERGVDQTFFDGKPQQHKMSKAVYDKKFAEADASYAAMLTLLIKQARGGE